MIKTPLSSIKVDGREFFVKRDDLIDPYLAGNKYRKLYTLLQAPKNRYKKIISYGGTQSNAMVAIAKMCYDKGWEFEYYTKPISQTQKQQKEGNFQIALRFGMQHKEIPLQLYKDFIASLTSIKEEETFLLHQGGATPSAKEGIKQLALELMQQNKQNLPLATPSGTGTTALFLALLLPQTKIYTTPVIGDAIYLEQQMAAFVSTLPKNLIILESAKKYPFGKINFEFYEIYQKLLDQTGIEFDLLYAPLMWKMLLEQTNEKLIYIHSGGMSGNITMLQRYNTFFHKK